MIESIKSKLDTWLADASPGKRLPTVRELAGHWDCSPTTIRKALKPYVADGRLVCRPGKGTFAGGLPQPPIPAVSEGSVEALHGALRHDISVGRLKQGRALPLVKRLSIERSVSPATVIAAYRLLVSDGLVEKSGRTYRVASPGENAWREGGGEVFHFREVGSLGSLDRPNSRVGRVMSEMCYELAHSGARISARSLPELEPFLRNCMRKRHFPLGIVAEGFYGETLAKQRNLIERFLHRGGRGRTAIVLVAGGREDPPRGIDIFCDGNFHTARARTIAQFAHSRNHASIAVYVEENRALAEDLRETLRMIPQIHRLGHPMPIRFFVCRSTNLPDTEAVMRLLTRRYKPTYLHGLLGKYGASTLQDFEERLSVVDDFGRVLETVPPKTLCIFRGMKYANAALQWCRENKVEVPSRIALLEASSDSSDLSSPVSICACDWRGTGYLMAHLLLRDIPVARTTKGLVPTRAIVLERETT